MRDASATATDDDENATVKKKHWMMFDAPSLSVCSCRPRKKKNFARSHFLSIARPRGAAHSRLLKKNMSDARSGNFREDIQQRLGRERDLAMSLIALEREAADRVYRDHCRRAQYSWRPSAAPPTGSRRRRSTLAIDHYFRTTFGTTARDGDSSSVGGGGGVGVGGGVGIGGGDVLCVPRILVVKSCRPRPHAKLHKLLEMGVPSQLATNICRTQSLDAS